MKFSVLLQYITPHRGVLLMMALIDPVIALCALILMPAYYFAMKIIGRRIRPVSRA